MSKAVVRSARLEDAERILEIYAYYVKHTAHKCGYKFGCWYNLIWMEKIVGDHRANQPPVRFQQTAKNSFRT